MLVAVKVAELLAKLPAKLKISFAVPDTSVQTAPLFRVTSPVRDIVMAVPLVADDQFTAPEIVVAPVTVKFRNMVTEASALTVNDPATLRLAVEGEVMRPVLVISKLPGSAAIHSEPAVNEAGLLYWSVDDA